MQSGGKIYMEVQLEMYDCALCIKNNKQTNEQTVTTVQI